MTNFNNIRTIKIKVKKIVFNIIIISLCITVKHFKYNDKQYSDVLIIRSGNAVTYILKFKYLKNHICHCKIKE